MNGYYSAEYDLAHGLNPVYGANLRRLAETAEKSETDVEPVGTPAGTYLYTPYSPYTHSFVPRAPGLYPFTYGAQPWNYRPYSAPYYNPYAYQFIPYRPLVRPVQAPGEVAGEETA